jgi:hypothetical protein
VRGAGEEHRTSANNVGRTPYLRGGSRLTRASKDIIRLVGAVQILFPQGWSAYPLKMTILFQNESEKETKIFYQLKNPGITEIKERNIRIIVTESVPEKIEKNSDCAILDKEKCGKFLIYRTICPDDYFIPFGRTKKTNALTFLSKQGMTKIERERVGVVVDSHNNLLWIPGIRINDSCRVTEMTTRVIKISFQTLCNIV